MAYIHFPFSPGHVNPNRNGEMRHPAATLSLQTTPPTKILCSCPVEEGNLQESTRSVRKDLLLHTSLDLQENSCLETFDQILQTSNTLEAQKLPYIQEAACQEPKTEDG